jgi:hypothetical protein
MNQCPKCNGQVLVNLEGESSCLQCGWAPREEPPPELSKPKSGTRR